MDRPRHEKSIHWLDPRRARKFEDAVTALAYRYGLDWFTDEQIAEIRSEMVQTEWDRRRRMRAQRKHVRAA